MFNYLQAKLRPDTKFLGIKKGPSIMDARDAVVSGQILLSFTELIKIHIILVTQPMSSEFEHFGLTIKSWGNGSVVERPL